jgi:hypothetical protein
MGSYDAYQFKKAITENKNRKEMMNNKENESKCGHYLVCYLIGMQTGCIADELHEICQHDTRTTRPVEQTPVPGQEAYDTHFLISPEPEGNFRLYVNFESNVFSLEVTKAELERLSNQLNEFHSRPAQQMAPEDVLKLIADAIENQKDHKEFLLTRGQKDIVLDIIDGIKAEFRQQSKQGGKRE